MTWMPEGAEPDTSDLPGPREIRKLNRLAGLLALVGPVEEACREVLKYWQPLLPACQRGETPVPRHALRTEEARARALVEALEAQPVSAIRDESLDRARKAAEAVARWLPQERGSHLTSSAYDGAIKSTPGSALPTGPSKLSDDELIRQAVSRRIRRMVIAVVLLGLFAAANFILPELLKPKPYEVEGEEYQERVPLVVEKELSGSTLVITMNDAWLKKDIKVRTDDIFRLMIVGAPEPYSQMVVRDDRGRNLAWVDLKGHIEWVGPLRQRKSE